MEETLRHYPKHEVVFMGTAEDLEKYCRENGVNSTFAYKHDKSEASPMVTVDDVDITVWDNNYSVGMWGNIMFRLFKEY